MAEFILSRSTGEEETIVFSVPGDPEGRPILQLGPGDEIRVRGKLVERDVEVVNALRHFLTSGELTTARIMYGGGE